MATLRTYFFCTPVRAPNHPFHHGLIALAEGMRALGVEVYGNADYWQETVGGPFLIRHDPAVRPEDCNLVLLDSIWCEHHPLPPAVQRAGRPYATVMVDLSDGHNPVSFLQEFRDFDLILRAQTNRGFRYPPNSVPWAFGLSNRILAATAGGAPAADREPTLLVNFRASHLLRQQAVAEIHPKLARVLRLDPATEAVADAPVGGDEALLCQQTGGRHHGNYYRRLRRAAACSVFGGYGAVDAHTQLTSLQQWDSWRLWEAMAAGCVAVHVDLVGYGALFPVPPVNWTHYVGVALNDVDAAVDRIAADPTLLPRIGAAGRAWATANYSPQATAARLLKLVDFRLTAAQPRPGMAVAA